MAEPFPVTLDFNTGSVPLLVWACCGVEFTGSFSA
jgi:hypothetical protein